MLKPNLVKEFNYELKQDNKIVSDFNIFQDKKELDNLRSKILEKLGDLTYISGDINRNLILDVINSETEKCNLTNLERSHLYNIIDNEINGYGPLTELLNDPSIEEIMVNGPDEIFIAINGEIIQDNSISFINNEHIIRTIKKMLNGTNIHLEEESSLVTKVDGIGTISLIMPPISIDGPVLTIKKFNPSIVSLDDLLKIGSLTPYMARFLSSAVKANLNILICGSTDSGKTSLLNSLGNIILENRRIITIENNSELEINKPNLVHLNNNTNILDITLKMQPETIIIGEINDSLVLKTLEIMNNKAINVFTTILANDALDAISKIENIGYIQSKLTSEYMRNSLYNAIDLIVTISEMPDHKHKITSIMEFNKNKNGEIVLKEIFAYKIKNILANGEVNGEYTMFKYIPRCYETIKKCGITESDEMFKN